jgi:hypothetical protein
MASPSHLNTFDRTLRGIFENAAVYNFCTYFDVNYLTRGIALYRSLKAFHDVRFWVLCLDAGSCSYLKQLDFPDVEIIPLAELEASDLELVAAKANRSTIEYYFTCTAALPLFIMAHHPEVDLITYLDADLFFFSSAQPLIDEIGDHSIAIIAHRFVPEFATAVAHGIYNVGWVSFRRDRQGLACLQLWREQCLAWCYDRVEEGRYADQKYLDDWPARYDNLVVLGHKGANLASWNIGNYALRAERGYVLVDSEPLIFFHFHGFKQLTRRIFDTRIDECRSTVSPLLRDLVVSPYVEALEAARRELLSQGIALTAPSIRRRWNPFFVVRWYEKLRTVASVLKRHYLYRALFIAAPDSDRNSHD